MRKKKFVNTNHKTNYVPIVIPKLTLKQKMFVNYYLVDRNATQAYMKAYGTKNRNVAAVEGHRLLSNPNVQKITASAIAESLKKIQVTRERLVDRMAEIAFNDNWGKHAVTCLDMLNRHMAIYTDVDKPKQIDDGTDGFEFIRTKDDKKKK